MESKNQILTHDQKMEAQESEGLVSISPEEAKELERILEEINKTGDAIWFILINLAKIIDYITQM